MLRKFAAGLMPSTLALVVLISGVGPGHAQEQGWPINQPTGSSEFPWNSAGFEGYSQPTYSNQPINTSAQMAQPQLHGLYAKELPTMKNTVDSNAFTLVAHVPANAQVWIQGQATTSTGNLRTYQSPSLTPGKDYTYSVQVAWVEDGKVVSQTQNFSAKAGGVHAVYVGKAKSKE